MLKIITWLWSQPGGRTTYTANHVNIWAAMLKRHLTIPFTLACVTDMPQGIDKDIEIIAPPNEFTDISTPTWNQGRPNCFRRLVLFSPNAEKIFGAKRFASMDLDAVIGSNVDDIFNKSGDFIMYRGTNFDRPYNGSLLMMDAGARPRVYTEFNLENAIASGQKYTGSDQAWIAYCLGTGEQTWSFEDGICWWGSQYNSSIPIKKIMFFPGVIKPWEVVVLGMDKWCIEHYRGERQGRCLILGHNKKVWTELEEQIESGPFDNYVISPEVARHWPYNYLDIAGDDKQAVILANMHGYKDYLFLGKS